MQFLSGIILFIAGIVWTKSIVRKFKKDKVNFIIDSVFDVVTYSFFELAAAVLVACLGIGLILSSFT